MLKLPMNFTVCSLAHSEMPQTAQNHLYLCKPQQGYHVEHPCTTSPKWVSVAKASLLEKAPYEVQLEIDLP